MVNYKNKLGQTPSCDRVRGFVAVQIFFRILSQPGLCMWLDKFERMIEVHCAVNKNRHGELRVEDWPFVLMAAIIMAFAKGRNITKFVQCDSARAVERAERLLVRLGH